jgi:hypothetical protein
VNEPKLDRDEILMRLRAADVLAAYGAAEHFRKSGPRELEARWCFQRADHSRRAMTINTETGRWQCRPCGYGGDALTMVAMFERLDIASDFPAVLARAAEIAGVTPSSNPEEMQRRREAARLQLAERQRAEEEERVRRERDSVPIATAYWDELPTRHPRGEEYLRERGVIEALGFDLIRFDPAHGGSPSLAVRRADGGIKNVVRRRLPELGEPRFMPIKGCSPVGSFVNAVSEIVSRSLPVVITEGFFDSITATLAWPRAVIIGAHGANNLEVLAGAVGERAAHVRARASIVPHRDEKGFSSAIAAHDAAMVSRCPLRIVRLPVNDLNAAWCSGWRPS